MLVHGGGVTRDEGGESGGLGEERTLTEHLNDIRVNLEEARALTGATTLSLLGTSFGGGLCAYYAAKRPQELTRLVLLNPQLRYKERYIDQKPHWHNDRLDDEAYLEPAGASRPRDCLRAQPTRPVRTCSPAAVSLVVGFEDWWDGGS